MNKTNLKAFLSSPASRKRLANAIRNCRENGYSNDHVSNAKGRNILAVKVRDGKLEITDRKYNDVTAMIISLNKSLQS